MMFLPLWFVVCPPPLIYPILSSWLLELHLRQPLSCMMHAHRSFLETPPSIIFPTTKSKHLHCSHQQLSLNPTSRLSKSQLFLPLLQSIHTILMINFRHQSLEICVCGRIVETGEFVDALLFEFVLYGGEFAFAC